MGNSEDRSRSTTVARGFQETWTGVLWPRCGLLLLLLLGIPGGPAAAVAADPVAVLVEGTSFPARLAGFTSDEPAGVAFHVDAGTRPVAFEDLVSWGSYRDSDRGVQAVLSDGSLLVGEFQRLDNDRLDLYSDLFGDVSLRLEQVRGLMFQPPAEPLQRDLLLDRIRSASRGTDRLLLDNGDLLQGVITGPPDAPGAPGAAVGPQPPAAVPESDNEALWLTMPGRPPLAIPLTRVAALIFNPTLIEPSRVRDRAIRVGLRDGSLLLVTAPSQADGWVRLPLACGLELQCDEVSALEEITLIEPHSARITYLSDLQPLGYKHIPFLGLGWEVGVDRNVLGGRLRSDGRIWSKGVGMHSTSRLAFDLDGTAERLEAALALDDRAGRRGSVIYRVFIDRDGQWLPGYQSPIVRGGQPPLPLSVDISGARRIALIVDFADRGDELDHANWLNARLVRGKDR